jgi:epoxide hydrolase-like predicted phosphatase
MVAKAAPAGNPDCGTTSPTYDAVMGAYRAVIVDYGGVLTSALGDALDVWCRADGIDREVVDAVVRQMYLEPASAVHRHETGELDPREFEAHFADRLFAAGSSPIQAEGLLNRMLGDFRSEMAMIDLVLAARRLGLKTALLSNSWGNDYPREGWDELFDVTVISGEVGMRKPDVEIFALTADRLRLPAKSCVFIDDLAHNVRGAAAAGMTGIHHVDAETTRAELAILLGEPLQ